VTNVYEKIDSRWLRFPTTCNPSPNERAMSAQVFFHNKTHAGAAKSSVRQWVPLVIVAIVVSALAFHAVVYGPAIRERAERLHAAQIDQENRALCSKLGMPYGTAQFAVCADVLSQVRQYEAKRVADEVAGIL
jgi:hypothetical protein